MQKQFYQPARACPALATPVITVPHLPPQLLLLELSRTCELVTHSSLLANCSL